MKGMSAAMKSMNLEKISTLMDNFEKEFEVNVSGENTNDTLIYLDNINIILQYLRQIKLRSNKFSHDEI